MKIGKIQKKILLSLAAGASLSLTRRPNQPFRIFKSFIRAWKDINEQSLQRSIRKLYQNKLIDSKEHDDGTVTLVISREGKKRLLRFNLDTITFQKPNVWDGKWRLVLFDIPEHLKRERDAFSQKLKQLGFLALQKSVFIFPYDCKNELDFMIEILNLRKYVRSMLATQIDNELDVKTRFKI